MRRKPRRNETGVKSLSPGTRCLLLQFENALVSNLCGMGSYIVYIKAKRALVRRLRRIEGTLPRDPRGRTPDPR